MHDCIKGHCRKLDVLDSRVHDSTLDVMMEVKYLGVILDSPD